MMKGHRWFAAMYDTLYQRFQKRLEEWRRWVVGGAEGQIVEIGAGTGASFLYYSKTQHVVATEPDPYMLRKAQRRAARIGLNVEFRPDAAEALAIPDASVDTVISTLVLCTVRDQAKALQEVRRVLKPGGQFRFIEHVRGQGILGRMHDLVSPVLQWLGAGCHLNRKTLEALEAAGFEVLEVQHKRFFFMPLIAGVARVRRAPTAT
jgi:ubiquinone/menaquinone biosynthesis C-methylase UbiE